MSNSAMIYDRNESYAGALDTYIVETGGIPVFRTTDLDEASESFLPGASSPKVLILDKSTVRNDSTTSLAEAIREKLNLEAGSFGSSGGFALARVAEAGSPKTRIIMLTGEENIAAAANVARVWGYGNKPIDPSVLLTAVQLGELQPEEMHKSAIELTAEWANSVNPERRG